VRDLLLKMSSLCDECGVDLPEMLVGFLSETLSLFKLLRWDGHGCDSLLSFAQAGLDFKNFFWTHPFRVGADSDNLTGCRTPAAEMCFAWKATV
jgi:hypothetical protein